MRRRITLDIELFPEDISNGDSDNGSACSLSSQVDLDSDAVLGSEDMAPSISLSLKPPKVYYWTKAQRG